MMARLLENLPAGTAVRTSDGELAGEVRAVYASGETLDAAFLLVYWHDRAHEALVGAGEVMAIDAAGVHLCSTGLIYSDLAAFEPSSNPLLHRLT